MISPKQEQVLDILATKDSMTAAEIAAELGSETKATSKHLRLLEEIGEIYVCEWRKGKFGVLTKAYKLGRGESVIVVSKRKKTKLTSQPVVVPEPNAPRPDYAAAWLFNNPRVELQGAKYD
jgi:predicted ArsR family transcriptional regulator